MININDADIWYETYMKLNDKKKDEYLINTLKQPLSKEFIEEIDYVEFIIELFDNSMKMKDYEKLIEMHGNIVKINPSIIKEDFYYIDRKFIDYYLHRKEKEKILLHMNSFISNPIGSIDYLLPVLSKLCCYGYDDLAVEICEKIYCSVKNSHELIGNVEQDLSNYILMYKIQEMYEDIKKGNSICKENILEFLKKYDRDITDYINMIIEMLESNGNNIKIIGRLDSKKSEADIIGRLELHFCKYMKDEKGINFNVSSDLWYSTIKNTIENSKIKDAEYPLDEYFLIDDKIYDEYLSQKFSFLSNDVIGAVKICYGIHYVYDYLYFAELISKETYDNCLQIIQEKRKIVLKHINKEAWKYNFICIWNKADSIDEHDYIAEKDFIQKIFYEDIDFKTYMPESYMKTFKEIANRLKEKEKNNRESKTIKKYINIGRNDTCPCGSGKKYKKCCGK